MNGTAVAGDLWIPDISNEMKQLEEFASKQICVKVPSIVCSGLAIQKHQMGMIVVRAMMVPISTTIAEVSVTAVEHMAGTQLLLFGETVLNLAMNEFVLRSRHFKEGGCPRLRIELIVAARVHAFAEVPE